MKSYLTQSLLALGCLGLGVAGSFFTSRPTPVARLTSPSVAAMAVPATAVPISLPAYAQQLWALTNAARVQAGLPALVWDPQLATAAAAHAAAMGVHDFYGHSGVDGTPATRAQAAGFPRHAAWGEIIAAAYNTPQNLFPVLWASPVCRTRLLQKDVTHIGIAVVHVPGSRWVWYWTLDTGARG